MGITFYYIAAKQYPFQATSEYDMVDLLLKHQIDFSVIKKGRESLQDQANLDLFIRFLRKLLTKNPIDRPIVDELLLD
jgi:serine/threonine protein kinase